MYLVVMRGFLIKRHIFYQFVYIVVPVTKNSIFITCGSFVSWGEGAQITP